MARRSAFSIKIDTSQVAGFADKVAGLTPEEVAATLVGAINETVDSAYELSRKTILNGVNLTDSYVQRRMVVEHATTSKPEASITALGGRQYTTNLSHYGAMQEHRKVNWTNARIASMGKKFGPWPGWTKRTGDAARGIPVDRKTHGVSVEVIKGRRKLMRREDNTSTMFIVPGKVDNDGNPLVMHRKSNGKATSSTGPSVYQLFKVAGAKIENQVADDLQQAVLAAAAIAFEEDLL